VGGGDARIPVVKKYPFNPFQHTLLATAPGCEATGLRPFTRTSKYMCVCPRGRGTRQIAPAILKSREDVILGCVCWTCGTKCVLLCIEEKYALMEVQEQ
jgi:hypothetical protein